MRIMYSLFLLVSLPIMAQVRAIVTDPDMANPKGPGIKTEKVNHKNTVLPPRDERENFFARFPAGAEAFKKFDELDRDFYYSDLKTLSVPDLKKKYPSIPGDVVEKMQQERKK